jgi:hypothetical protein
VKRLKWSFLIPYNVPIDGNDGDKGAIRHREFATAAGEMSAKEFIAFLCEIDPIYCDRIIRRWEAYAKDDGELTACGTQSVICDPQ